MGWFPHPPRSCSWQDGNADYTSTCFNKSVWNNHQNPTSISNHSFGNMDSTQNGTELGLNHLYIYISPQLFNIDLKTSFRLCLQNVVREIEESQE